MTIFAPVFGQAWAQLPPVFIKHYANRANTNDIVTLEGKMQVAMSPLMKLFSPFLRLAGLLVPYEGEFNAIVRFKSHGEGFIFEREVHIAPTKTFYFRSKMFPKGGATMNEYFNLGFIWVADFLYADNKIKIIHKGYKYKCFGIEFKLPLEWLLGKGSAYETAIDDNNFTMQMSIDHAFFGRVYSYSGQFLVKDVVMT